MHHQFALICRLMGRCFLLTAIYSVLCVSARAGDSWPQFRGPNGDGKSDATDLPVTFSETENLRWKTPIHDKGWSSPVVLGDQIWLTTATADGKELYVVCVDLNTGKIKFDQKLFTIETPQTAHEFNSYASPTPVIENGRVYVHFGSPGTAAIDTATGKVIWKRQDLPCFHFRGAGSSPIIVDNLLILTFDGYDFNYLAALDKRTGETVWKHDRNFEYTTDNGDYHKSFSTPHVIEVAGHRQLISPSAGATAAYDPATGNEIWRVRSGGMNAASRALYGNGLVYCVAPDGGFQLFAVKPEGAGDITNTNVAWKTNKGVPTRASPILLDDLLFMGGNAGVLSCVNAKTGEITRQKRTSAKFTASPVYADGKLYFFSEDGEAPVIAADRELTQLAENHFEPGFMSSPAIIGRSLIVRSKTNLYRFEKP
jgi:outer membrane protein assembly factor BamB